MNINPIETYRNPIGKPRTKTARGLLYLFLLLTLTLPMAVANGAKSLNTENKPLSASLITAWPGSEIYELCGHEAIRIKGEDFDSVWNFGIFNFNEPNFVYRFVKGETDYNVMGYPFRYFLPEYVERGSRVEEQVLNLNPAQVDSLRLLLQLHSRPPLSRYRYNYIRNNCSTQIADLLDEAAGGPVLYTAKVNHSSFRDAMRDYHKNYPWYQFGIDLALGSGLDVPLSQREELFIPVEFNRHAADAFLPDGKPLVRNVNVLNEGSSDAVLPPTPWYATPWFTAFLVFVFTVVMAFIDWRNKTIAKWWYAVFFGIEGIAGCLIFFLVFISVHAATSPNILIFWLNPLQLIVPVCIWSRKTRIAVKALMWLNFCIVGLMIVLIPFYYSGQGQQWALVWLMISDFIMAFNYIFGDKRIGANSSPGRGAKKGRRMAKRKKYTARTRKRK